MGIYDSTIDLEFGPAIQKKIILAGAAILLILVIAAFGFWVSDFMKPNALKAEFSKNTIKPGETTKLVVTVTNIEKVDASNVPVSAMAKEKTDFQVFPESQKFGGKVELISAGASREITFIVNPVQRVLPGTYTFVAKTSINGEDYSKDTVLTVKE